MVQGRVHEEIATHSIHFLPACQGKIQGIELRQKHPKRRSSGRAKSRVMLNFTLDIMISKFRNIGKNSQEMLAAAGITSERQLKTKGAVADYLIAFMD